MIFELSSLQPIFLIIACFGLFFSISSEQSQIVARTRGAFAGRIATGYNRAMRIMIFQRFGAIGYVLFISLCIDTGVSNQAIVLVSITASLGVMMYNLKLVLDRAKVLQFDGENKSERLSEYLFGESKRYALASYAATLFNIMGLSLPFLLSNMFPEYRLTMANTGFILNAFFTMINVLIIESRYSHIVDHDTNDDVYRFVVMVFLSRALSLFCAALILVGLLFFVP